MLTNILNTVITGVISIISLIGYPGIFLLMALETCGIPIPSEIIMGISGYLVYKGSLNLLLVVLVGALGNALGSSILYYIGMKGGRPIVNKYGHYIHLNKERFDSVEEWFKKYGDITIIIFQLLPVVRTFAALPLGVMKVNFWKFRIYTFIGAVIWCFILTYISYLLGPQWTLISDYIKKFEYVILAIVILAIIGYIINKIIKSRRVKKNEDIMN